MKSAWQQSLQVLFWVINIPLLFIGYIGVLATLESYITDTVPGLYPLIFCSPSLVLLPSLAFALFSPYAGDRYPPYAYFMG